LLRKAGRIIIHSRLTHYIVITIITVLAYVPIFPGDFVLDDKALIRDNPYITELQSLPSYLSQEDGVPDSEDQKSFHTGYYRPFVNLTYFVDYKVWGMKAYGFRATNLILHLFTCFMLYALLLRLIKSRSKVFWITLLFALHPVQTEAISMIVSRNNLLVAFFTLASFYSYLVWWEHRRSLFLILSLTAFTAAAFSKEFGLMILPVFFLYHRLLSEDKNLRREVESYVPYTIILLVYLVLRKTVVTTSFIIPDDIALRLAYVPYLLAYNLKLIFIPYNLHSFSVNYPNSLLAPEVIGAFLFAIVLAVGLYLLRKESLLVFSAGAFFLALIPIFNVIDKPSVSLIAMRWLYLPMAFLTLGVASFLIKIEENYRLTEQIVLSAVAVYLGAFSYSLNAYLWKDHNLFIKQEVLHFNNGLYMGDYAEIMFVRKEYETAEYFFQRSLKLFPRRSYNYINYSSLLIDTKRYDEALMMLEKVRNLNMIRKESSSWNNNMGAALALTGRYTQAYEYFRTAMKLNPQNEMVRRNLAAMVAMDKRNGVLGSTLRHREIDRLAVPDEKKTRADQ
jgi:tetratricopeptide (TPR) repeat protein